MASSKLPGSRIFATILRYIPSVPIAILAWVGSPSRADAQLQLLPQPQGFAVERLYLAAPGSAWFVMNDLNMAGGWGGAVAFASSYSRKPLQVKSSDGTQNLSLISDEVMTDVGVAATYGRYRFYLNFPMPLVVSGKSGVVGSYQLNGPAVNVGSNPDGISDPRVGADVRLFGQPGSPMRVGVGAQLFFPAGDRADYVTDGTYRGMFRFMAAGDAGRFSYAGQFGVHARPLNDFPAPGSPNGSEFLFGAGAGRKFSVRSGWAVFVGPEVFGETAFNSFFNGQTGVEGLLTGRLERTGSGPHLRVKAGVGHGIVEHFGTPEWRIVFGVEVFGQRQCC